MRSSSGQARRAENAERAQVRETDERAGQTRWLAKRSRMTRSRARVLVALALAGAVAGAAPKPLGGPRAASPSAAPPGLRRKPASALAAAPQIRRLQAGGDADRLLAFKASGNGAGLESWAAGSEPCGAGWDSYEEGWLGLRCDAAGGSVERMCAPQPFLVCALHRLSVLTSCRGWAAAFSTACPASPRTSARWPGSR